MNVLNLLFPRVPAKAGGFVLSEGVRRVAIVLSALWLIWVGVGVVNVAMEAQGCGTSIWNRCSRYRSDLFQLVLIALAGPVGISIVLRALAWIRGGFKADMRDRAPTGTQATTNKAQAGHNLLLVSAIAEKVGKDALAMAAGIETNRGPMQALMTKLMKPTIAMYALGLHGLCKSVANPSYMESEEYQMTKQLVIYQSVVQDTSNLAETGAPVDKETVLRSYLKDSRDIEEAVQDAKRRLSAGDATPTIQLDKWFESKTGVSQINGLSVQNYTRSLLSWITERLRGGG